MAKRLAQFPEKSASEKTKSDIAELKSDYDAVKEKMTQAQGHFDTLVKLLDGDKRTEFTAMVKVLKSELNPEAMPRLETFLGQAAQAERDRAMKKSTPGAAELLSLAVTGWLLGNASAEAVPDRALQLWEARNLVLEYQKDAPGKRELRLSAYLARPRCRWMRSCR